MEKTISIKEKWKRLIKEIKKLWKIRTFKSYNKYEIEKLKNSCKEIR